MKKTLSTLHRKEHDHVKEYNNLPRANEMVQWVKVLGAEAKDTSLIPGTSMVWRTNSWQSSSDSAYILL